MALLAGCAAAPHELLAVQRREIACAEAAGAAGLPQSLFYLKAARAEVQEAERLFRMGAQQEAEARLGNAQADARLARAVVEAERTRSAEAPAPEGAHRTSIPAASLFRGQSAELLPGGEALLTHLVRRLIWQQDRTIALHTYAQEDADLAQEQAAQVKAYLLGHGLRDGQLLSENAGLTAHEARLEVTVHGAP